MVNNIDTMETDERFHQERFEVNGDTIGDLIEGMTRWMVNEHPFSAEFVLDSVKENIIKVKEATKKAQKDALNKLFKKEGN